MLTEKILDYDKDELCEADSKSDDDANECYALNATIIAVGVMIININNTSVITIDIIYIPFSSYFPSTFTR